LKVVVDIARIFLTVNHFFETDFRTAVDRGIWPGDQIAA
jgi:hypothetical protein